MQYAPFLANSLITSKIKSILPPCDVTNFDLTPSTQLDFRRDNYGTWFAFFQALQMSCLSLFALQMLQQLKDYINIKKCKFGNKTQISDLQFVN